MSPCDTPRFSFRRLFKTKFPPPHPGYVTPPDVSRGVSLGWSRDGSLGSGNTCFSLPSAPCLFWATTFWTITSLFLVCLQPLPLCAAAPSHLIRSQHSLPNLMSLCSHHCNPTGTSGPLHILFPNIFQGCLFLGITPEKRGLSATPGIKCGAP